MKGEGLNCQCSVALVRTGTPPASQVPSPLALLSEGPDTDGMDLSSYARIVPAPPSLLVGQKSKLGAIGMPVAAVGAFLLLLVLSSSSSPFLTSLFRPTPLESPVHVLLLLAALFTALVWHEVGHLLAAICSRFEIATVNLGFVCFRRTQLGWRVGGRFRKVFTGSVVAMPRDNAHWRERMLAVVAAGPAATLLGVLLAMYAVHSGLLPHWAAAYSVDFFQISFIIFVLGLIPLSTQAAESDASLFLALWRDGSDANALFLYHLVLQHQRQGLEPCQFPLWLVQLMASFRGRADFMVLYAGMVASWAFERGDHRSGNVWDEQALLLSSKANAATRSACLANSACFDLVFRSDLAGAKAKLDSIQMTVITSPSLQHRVQAARDLVLGQIRRSLAEIAAARTALPPELQDGGFEWSMLRRLHASALSLR